MVQMRVDGDVPSTRFPFPAGETLVWHGTAQRLDGARAALLLTEPQGDDDLRARTPSAIAKLRRARNAQPRATANDDTRPGALILGNGTRTWQATALRDRRGDILLAFDGPPPPARAPLRILQSPTLPDPGPARQTICFTPGTRIDTPRGPVPVETLRPGDTVSTRDDGAQPVLWTGHRHIPSARLLALPALRPVRLRAGALGHGLPHADLVVSPDHQVLLRGPRARALFTEPEVLVRAGDLIDGRRVLIDHRSEDATYIHLMFDRHQVVTANGAPCESFHPAQADLSHLAASERAALNRALPDADRYGPVARRALDAGELALLRHGHAPRHLA